MTDLPAPLAAYFAAANRGDRTTMAGLFADTAKVRDEGKTHTDRAAIRGWLDRVGASYDPRYVVQGVESEADASIVTVQVSGTFPGSPIVLRQRFETDGDHIVSLATL